MGFSKRDDMSTSSDESVNDIFKSITKNRTTFCVWRIDTGLRTTVISRITIGKFFCDSAYLIYAVSAKDGPLPYPGMPTKEVKENGSLSAIHFWIGSQCDASVSGAAALRAAELDSRVCATVLFRETQGRESARFLAYFKQDIVVAFLHEDQTPTCTLHRVSGLVVPILTELENVDWKYFNSRDVIIIDVHSRGVVYLWLGSSADPLHKRHAAHLLQQRKKNNNTRVFIVDDGYEQTLRGEASQLLDQVLKPSTRTVLPHHQRAVNVVPQPAKLYVCNEQNGKYKVAELKSGPITVDDLTPSNVYLIDRGEVGVWVWVGSEANTRERLEAIRNARGFIKKKEYSPSVPVARALQSQEPPEMKSLVRGWEQSRITPLTLPEHFEADFMAERPRMAAECQLVDDGSADRVIWTCSRDQGLVQIPDSGIFYAAACYLIKYKYGQGRRSKTIIYCWEGAHSNCADRETTLNEACRMAKEYSAQLVKASQGWEPSHLLQMYNGKLRILTGEHRDKPPRKYLVRVHGTVSYTSKAVERPLKASSLDSAGVFILFSDNPMVWCGQRSTGDAREASRRLAPSTAPLISENKETEEFWNQLGGRGVYGPEFVQQSVETYKHVYHCQIEDNKFVGCEVLGFSQNSLLPEAAWILDAGQAVWVWIGKYSGVQSFENAVQFATVYLYTHPASRDRNTIINVIEQGQEPPTFIGLFDSWNYNLLRDYCSFATLRSMLQEQESHIYTSTPIKLVSGFNNYVKYPIRILKDKPENLPSGIDVSRKEMHLTFDDFVSIFNMEPADFEDLPAWKKQRLKQAAGLF